MSVKQLDFSKHNLVIDLAEVKRMFRMHFNEGCRYLVKQAFERIMAQDMYEHICARVYERTPVREGYRNGYRARTLLTSVGVIELEVPRDRAGECVPECFEQYKSGTLPDHPFALFQISHAKFLTSPLKFLSVLNIISNTGGGPVSEKVIYQIDNIFNINVTITACVTNYRSGTGFENIVYQINDINYIY